MSRFVISLIIFAFPALVSADVFINEIAWMGNGNSANDEFIELYNNGGNTVNLEGWSLVAGDGSPNIVLSGTISAKGYFLLERSDDDSVPGTSADIIYAGALGNSGEHLTLMNSSGVSIDALSYGDGWPAGDNTTKETMQRTSSGAWITAVPTPRTANIVTTEESKEETTEQNNMSYDASNESGNTAYIPPEKLPHITVYAGKDRTVIAGERILFDGSAFGLEGEHLENARYVWSFGDAQVREGKKVPYEYMHPGSYIVRLTVSSGKFSAIDDMRITVVAGEIALSEIKPGADGWIEIVNNESRDVHLGGWILKTRSSPATTFILPSGMLIAGNSHIVLLNTTTHLSFTEAGGLVTASYPNGTIFDSISYAMYVPPDKSISKDNTFIMLTNPTPGRVNGIDGTEQDMKIREENTGAIKSKEKNEEKNIQSVENIKQNEENKKITSEKENTQSEEFRPLSATVYDSGGSGGPLSVTFRSLLISMGIGVGVAILALIAKKRLHPDITRLSGQA